MQLSDFLYDLPDEKIAQTPLSPRDHSKLLVLNRANEALEEKKFYELSDDLWENDVLVLNHTKVIPARLFWEISIEVNGKKQSKTVEVFLLKPLSSNSWECLVHPWRNFKIGKKITFCDKSGKKVLKAEVKAQTRAGREIIFHEHPKNLYEIFEHIGNIPLPPYITEKLEDKNRYQTVFAVSCGSVAAPTAWLHFTHELLQKLKEKGVKVETVLLHVGLGTFQTVKTNNIKDHEMHTEFIEISPEVSERLNGYKASGKRIIAVWTTVVRTLESMTDRNGVLHSGTKETSIFIYPWYEWRFVDSIITNFHLSGSTLLMLVSSFAGIEAIQQAYAYAIEHDFRFFSFWDAMWIR